MTEKWTEKETEKSLRRQDMTGQNRQTEFSDSQADDQTDKQTERWGGREIEIEREGGLR